MPLHNLWHTCKLFLMIYFNDCKIMCACKCAPTFCQFCDTKFLFYMFQKVVPVSVCICINVCTLRLFVNSSTVWCLYADFSFRVTLWMSERWSIFRSFPCSSRTFHCSLSWHIQPSLHLCGLYTRCGETINLVSYIPYSSPCQYITRISSTYKVLTLFSAQRKKKVPLLRPCVMKGKDR